MGKVDSDGNLALTYEVFVWCGGKRFMLLGTGCDDVIKFYDIVKKGEINAIKVDEKDWGYNIDVTLTGKALLDIIQKFYPDKLGEAKKNIKLKEEYFNTCVDFS